MYKKYFKRMLDLLFSVIGTIVLIPIFVVVALLVKIKLGGPILFYQNRPGKDEKIFKMYKFRTMTSEVDEQGKLLPDSQRLNNFGRKLRSSSLDELPSLINIIKGDMSIIGPRPLAVQYLPFYNDFEKKRHNMRPGLSGLAQVNGRNTVNWDERFKYDIYYVENVSLILDIKIFFKTIIKVFKKSDIGERGVDAPMDFDKYRKRGN